MRDHCYVDCTECREALSACLDGEANAEESRAVDAHLTICAACRWYGDEAARVTKLARAAVTTQDATAEPVFTIDGLATVRQVLTELDRVSTTCATAMMAYHT
ncbi:MAG: zf-HC2 domain-containing protein, partial [Pseudonocardiaceae bacterium]